MLDEILALIDENNYCLVMVNEKWYSFVDFNPEEEEFICTDKEGTLYTFLLNEIQEVQ